MNISEKAVLLSSMHYDFRRSELSSKYTQNFTKFQFCFKLGNITTTVVCVFLLLDLNLSYLPIANLGWTYIILTPDLENLKQVTMS
jgi:putative flippase GtrA